MADAENTIVPLDVAHEALSTFGIDGSSKGYQRWRRDDGFRLVDFEGVLFGESQFILSVDWREWLKDAVDTILDQLNAIGVSATADLGEEGVQGYIEIDGIRKAIKYVPSDEDDFDDVVCSINSLLGNKAQYRKLRSSEGSDGWTYGVLTHDDWKALESNATELANLLFTPATS